MHAWEGGTFYVGLFITGLLLGLGGPTGLSVGEGGGRCMGGGDLLRGPLHHRVAAGPGGTYRAVGM